MSVAQQTINQHYPEDNIVPVHAKSDFSHEVQLIKKTLNEKIFQRISKRLFDLIASTLLIVLFLPIFLLISLIIKLTSKGTIFHSNERVGFHGNHFRCYKFRSMIIDEVTRVEDYKIALELQKTGILHKKKNDTRITWIGKIIRKTSIDELPQLFNVFKGDMSIVGPRPLVPFMLKPYPEFNAIRNLVRPGITGLWQIRDRKNNTSAEFMISHDTEYIKSYSLLLDLRILIKTPFIVISGKGAC